MSKDTNYKDALEDYLFWLEEGKRELFYQQEAAIRRQDTREVLRVSQLFVEQEQYIDNVMFYMEEVIGEGE